MRVPLKPGEFDDCYYEFPAIAFAVEEEQYPWLLDRAKCEEDSGNICHICRQIDFSYLLRGHDISFDVDDPISGKKRNLNFIGISLGSSEEMKRRENCDFCQLQFPIKLYAEETAIILCCGYLRSNSAFGSHHPSLRSLDLKGLQSGIQRDYLLPLGDDKDDVPHGIELSDSVNFAKIQTWVEECADDDDTFKALSSVFGSSDMDRVRYMDVRRGCLVEGLDGQDPKDAYAALSYVWGFK